MYHPMCVIFKSMNCLKFLLFLLVFCNINYVKSEHVLNGNHVMKGVKEFLITRVLNSWANSTQNYIYTTFNNVPLNAASADFLSCYRDVNTVIKGLNNLEFWALKMVDSSSKLQSGFLGGNIVDLGQYDECVKIERSSFRGQYCLVNLVLQINSSFKIEVPQDVLNGALTLTSALCVPSTCGYKIVELVANSEIKKFKHPLISGLNITARVNENDCHTNEAVPLSLAEYIVIAVCSVFVALVIISTVFDVLMRRKGGSIMPSRSHILLRAFSAPRNCRRLLNTNMAEGSLSCINGARFICIAWVALGHRYKFTCQQPLVNLLYLPEALKSWWSMMIVNATLSVDVFFLLGGLLNSYVYMKAPGRKHNLKSTILDFIHRYLRLTPAYALMIAITATWIYRLGDGPLWDRLVGTASNNCKEHWFPGVIYINNYYRTDSYCMMQSWYLAADMQMFWLSPILLYPLWRWPKFGLIEGGILIILSILTPFYVAFKEEIKTPIPLSRNTARVQREMETLYLPTHTKTISYIIGILLGYLIYLIKSNKINWNLSLVHKIIGWVLAVIFIVGSLLGAHPLFQVDHPYNKWESSLYIGFYRFFWALGIGWVFLACCTGDGGILTQILNCKPLIILGRLSYGIYLTHVAVIIQKIGSGRQPTFLNHYDQITQFLGEFLITILCALALTLTLESPFLVIEKILLRRRGTVVPENNVKLSGRAANAIDSDEGRRNSNCTLQRTA